MVRVQRAKMPSYTPIVGFELTPYIQLRLADDTVTTDDVPETAPIDGRFLRCKWYRVHVGKEEYTCSIHPSEKATLQCLECFKSGVPLARSFHCTSKCYLEAWPHHRVLHDCARNAANLVNGSGVQYPAVVTQRYGETWYEVGRYKTYIPKADDIGFVLKFECVVVHAETKKPTGHVYTIPTSQVIPAPSLTPRRLVPIEGVGHLDADGPKTSSGTFTVLSYNILSETNATNDLYKYCPSWALSWIYRKQNLLREIVGYDADIICLQEVQSDHYEEYFAPELDKHGYNGIYKMKTTEVDSDNTSTIDGCATFFRRDRFSYVKKYEVEFNKAAQSFTNGMIPTKKKAALNRLVKDNVALVVVLEAKVDNPAKKQLLYVANTHVNVDHDLKDVKLWQVYSLLRGLEQRVESGDIPMLVCGDFNSVPGSTVHALLTTGKINPWHADLATDPLNILRPHSKFAHKFPLVSAYSSFARTDGLGFELHKRRLDGRTNEPLFTSVTKDFIGTLDYIFYTANSLAVESLLELLDEERLRKETALPSPEWSSDHIALLAEFRYCKNKSRH